MWLLVVPNELSGCEPLVYLPSPPCAPCTPHAPLPGHIHGSPAFLRFPYTICFVVFPAGRWRLRLVIATTQFCRRRNSLLLPRSTNIGANAVGLLLLVGLGSLGYRGLSSGGLKVSRLAPRVFGLKDRFPSWIALGPKEGGASERANSQAGRAKSRGGWSR